MTLATVMVTSSVPAWSGHPRLDPLTGSAVGLPPDRGLDIRGLQPKLSPLVRHAEGRITAFIELDSTPAAAAFLESKRVGASDQDAQKAGVAAKRAAIAAGEQVARGLRSRDSGAVLIGRTTNAVAGVTVNADAARIRELVDAPGVVAVRPVIPKTIANSSADQLTRAIDTWRNPGMTGDGMRIGIIDDGVDYTHATFGGPGTEEAYKAIDRTKVDPSYFPTDKVVGGIDLVGDDYDSSGNHGPDALTPKPDPNPLSCGTHGTHVAGTAAGFGVTSEGGTFEGDHTTLDAKAVENMRVGPGSAPEALIYAIKVFGCHGSTEVTNIALDWALDPDGDGDFTDRLDVVNLSLGSDYGAPDDPDSLFVRKLAQYGVLSVIAAGNGGDLYDVGGSPGNTPEALTVASTRDGYVLRDAAEVTGPDAVKGVKAGQYSQNFPKYAELNLTGRVVPLTEESNKDGCDPLNDADKAAVKGMIAWLEWDDTDATRRCGSAARTNHVTEAGAIGAVFSSSVDNFNAGIAGNEKIPVFQFTGTASAALRPALAEGRLEVRLAGELRTTMKTFSPEITDTASTFTSRSSRGPAVKPDVAAPGDTIASALSGSGNKPLVISGTSMATPHTAGLSTLVRQRHRDWTPEEVKAAVLTTAVTDVRSGPGGRIHAPNRVGNGRVDAKSAVDNEVLPMVEDNPGSVSVSFGTVEAGGEVSVTKTVRVVNKGVKPVEYRLGHTQANPVPGVSWQLSTDKLKITPRGVARFTVTFKVTDPTALRKLIDPTMETTQLKVARQFLTDSSGWITFTPTAGSTIPLRLSTYAAPKPVSDITVTDKLAFAGDQAVLNLTGRGVDQGESANAYRSLISVFEAHGVSPQLPDCRGQVKDDCAVNATARGGDLRAVGAASTAPLLRQQGRADQALLAFGVTTWKDWAGLGGNTAPFVSIDTTGDGKPDFQVSVTKAAGTDVLTATTVNLGKPLPDGKYELADSQPVNTHHGDVDTNVFDTNVVVLPVSIKALGIDPTKPSAKISYTVGVNGMYVAPGDKDRLVDAIKTPMSFDVLAPALWVQGGGDAALTYLARPGTGLVVNRRPGVESGELLVLHHHNARDHRVQTVAVSK